LQTDKLGTADALCNAMDLRMLIVNSDILSDSIDHRTVLNCLFREALLCHAALFLGEWVQKYIETGHFGMQLILDYAVKTKSVVFYREDISGKPEAGSPQADSKGLRCRFRRKPLRRKYGKKR
jgi:hypothetical protein